MPFMIVHKLCFLETTPYSNGSFICNLCWEKGSGSVYHCPDCAFDVHAACAAIAKEQTHFSHYQHPLRLCYCSTLHTCDGCGHAIHDLAFRCETCDFDMHSLCVRAPRFISHPSHIHPLALSKSSRLHPDQCDACGKQTTDLSYQCRDCDYRLHQFCAKLPSEVKHPNHPQHTLRLLTELPNDAGVLECSLCAEQGEGWRFHCGSCCFNVHISCTNILHELPYSSLELSAHESRISNVLAATLNLPNAPLPCSDDLEAVERVLRFARGMVSGPSSHGIEEISQKYTNDEQEVCPTCLEGFQYGNPKRSTMCGHHFHLPCILQWMERSTCCPICRKDVNILM